HRNKPTDASPGSWTITLVTPADEHRQIIIDANVLLWAISIMTFTYSFIHHFIDNSEHTPPFDLPEVCFIHAGVAIVHDPATVPMISKLSICRSYLVEELIDEERDGFYKFINNGNAVSLP
ncbi:hypothetical protein B0H14DRAFT_2220150, partial [Mycena olivaceomarginata]